MEQKNLRWGYTTGTCAAAAAKAAAAFWLNGTKRPMETVTLPGGGRLSVPVTAWQSEPGWFAVKKDGGDDPDVTDGTWICAGVNPVSQEEFNCLREDGAGYVLEEYPKLYLTGGEGVGVAVRPGLSCPEGHYAINPGPRKMILSEVSQVLEAAGQDGFFCIRIQIPEGEVLAGRTFNPKLGIQGGISVLGTTGLVKPMSEEALLETIRLEIHMETAAGRSVMLMVPGNYGESFLREQRGVETGQAVLCSNFVKQAVSYAAEEQISEVLFAAHIGKLIKVAAGAGNTHSKYGDGRMEEMAELSRVCMAEKGLAPELGFLEQIRGCNTTEEALGLLKKAGLSQAVLELAACRAKQHMEQWGGGRISVQVMTFSAAYGMLGETEGAESTLRRWKQQRGWEEEAL